MKFGLKCSCVLRYQIETVLYKKITIWFVESFEQKPHNICFLIQVKRVKAVLPVIFLAFLDHQAPKGFQGNQVKHKTRALLDQKETVLQDLHCIPITAFVRWFHLQNARNIKNCVISAGWNFTFIGKSL